MRSRVRARAVLLLPAALALGACGVPLQDSPSALPAGAVPQELTSGAPVPTPTQDLVALRPVYLLAGDQLVPAARTIAAPGTLDQRLRSLLRGPNAVEFAQGLRSAIPAGTGLRRVSQSDGVATVDLTGFLGQSGGEAQRTAVAQLVYTVTEPDTGAKSMLLMLEGEAVAVPGPGGQLIDRPLTRDDVSTVPQGTAS